MEFDWEGWKEAEVRRNEARASRIRSRLEESRIEAANIANKMLAIDPCITSIILFGSAARGDPASEHFDIDIAVKDATRFALLEAAAVSRDFAVDLIQLEFAPPRLAENIGREGIVLYGQA